MHGVCLAVEGGANNSRSGDGRRQAPIMPPPLCPLEGSLAASAGRAVGLIAFLIAAIFVRHIPRPGQPLPATPTTLLPRCQPARPCRPPGATGSSPAGPS